MKKRVLILALAAAVFAACDKDDNERESGRTDCPIAKVALVSYGADDEGGPFSKFFEVTMEPSFDVQGRLTRVNRQSSGMSTEVRGDEDIYHYLKDLDETVEIVYNPDHTGKMVYKGKTFSYRFHNGVPTAYEDPFEIEIPLVFNEDWNIMREGESTYEYEYSDGYFQEYDVKWENGDLMSFGQYSFTYSDEPNPFRDWIDFTGGFISIPEEFSFGLMGKRSAHIPATIEDEESFFPITNVSVTKDSKGRIKHIRYDREDESTTYSTLEIEYKK